MMPDLLQTQRNTIRSGAWKKKRKRKEKKRRKKARYKFGSRLTIVASRDIRKSFPPTTTLGTRLDQTRPCLI
jgi:hypothetical protein